MEDRIDLPPFLDENQTSIIDRGPGNTNTTPASTTLSPWENDYFIAGAIMFPLVIILLVANILMFAAVLDLIIINRRKETCSSPILVMNLAIADIMMGIGALLAMTDLRISRGVLEFCYAMIGMIAMPTMASCLIMAAIAMDRYIFVRKPFRNTKHDGRKIAVTVIVIWLSSCLVGFAPLMGWRSENPVWTNGRCVFLNVVPSSYILFQFFGVFLPILTLTSYLHIVMCQASRRQGRKIAATEIIPRKIVRCKSADDIRNSTKVQEIEYDEPRRSNSFCHPSSERVEIFTVDKEEFASKNTEVETDSRVMQETIMSDEHTPSDPMPDKRTESTSSHFPKILSSLKPMKWSRTVILILGFFTCMWMPFWIVCVMQALCAGDCEFEGLASTYLLLLGLSNAAVNPMVYISTDKKLKEHFCRCFFQPPTSENFDSESVFFPDEESQID